MTTVNRTTTQARDAQVIAGIQKQLQNTPSLPLGGTAYTPADVVKLVQSRIDSAHTVAAGKANWHSTVVATKALNTNLTPVIRALRDYVINVFGAASPVLADFGFAPPSGRQGRRSRRRRLRRKPRPPARLATRQARTRRRTSREPSRPPSSSLRRFRRSPPRRPRQPQDPRPSRRAPRSP